MKLKANCCEVHSMVRRRSVVVPGAAAVSEGEIPRVHFRTRSRQRLRPVCRPDPGEERMALHP